MSTRAHIGYRKENNRIVAVYNHSDSYPTGLLVDAIKYINNNGIEKFVEMIDFGGLHGGFRNFPECYDNNENWTVKNRKELDNDYAYIFDSKTGELVELYRWGKLSDISSTARDNNIDITINKKDSQCILNCNVANCSSVNKGCSGCRWNKKDKGDVLDPVREEVKEQTKEEIEELRKMKELME